MKHNEYKVKVRTVIDDEAFTDYIMIGPDHEYATLNDLYEEMCKQQQQLVIDHFEIIVSSD